MPRRRELPLNPYAAEPLAVWEARLKGSGPSEERSRAFAAVTQLATADVACEYALRLQQDADAELRAAAARWLSTAVRYGRLDGELAAQRNAVIECLQHLVNDTDPDVRLEAARGLARLHPENPRLAEMICELLGRDEAHPTTQAAMAELCGWLPAIADRTLPLLDGWLTAEAAELREAVATALAQLGPLSSPLETALAAALDDEEPLVREQAAIALGRLPTTSAATITALEEAARDDDAAVAEAARAALSGIQRCGTER